MESQTSNLYKKKNRKREFADLSICGIAVFSLRTKSIEEQCFITQKCFNFPAINTIPTDRHRTI